MSCLLQNGHVYSILRERIAFRAPSFHLAVEIQSVMQTMQVCLINTYSVCVEREVPLGECEYKITQLYTPTIDQKWSDGWIQGKIGGRVV